MPRAGRNQKTEGRILELQAQLERERRVNEALCEVSMAIGRTLDLDSLLELILERITEVLDAERGTLYLLRDGKLVSRIKKGDELTTIEVEVGQGIAGHVARTGKPVRVPDAYLDDRFDQSWDRQSGYRTRAILAVPLKNHLGRTVGVVQVLNKRGQAGPEFTKHDCGLLCALAMQAAVAIDKSDLFRQLVSNNEQLFDTKLRLERRLRDIELLYDLETSMSRAMHVHDLARHVITHAAEACAAEAGTLLYDTGEGQLALYVVNMDNPGDVREVIVQRGEGVAARAMEHGKLLRVDEARRIKDPTRVREQLGIVVRSAIAAPLVADDERLCGALALYNHRGRPSRFTDDDGALLKLVSANVSTELRLFHERQERERSERLTSIGRLLSGIMHDLKTPLTVISGYVQLMQVADDPAVRADYGQTVLEQFEIIGSMQKDILAYARGETSVLVRKVYLSRFFDDLGSQLEARLAGTDIRLKMKVDRAATAFFDEGKMRRVLQNLTNNAVEAMSRSGGTLTLGAKTAGDDLLIEVTDTGPGIPKAIRKRLFEPFVTAGKRTGTGLGLSIVRKIVEEHGGTVQVECRRRGTAFFVQLPGATRPVSRRSPGPLSTPASSRRRIAPVSVPKSPALPGSSVEWRGELPDSSSNGPPEGAPKGGRARSPDRAPARSTGSGGP